MRYWLIMPAAGSGSRFGGDIPKQYLQLNGSSVMERALAPFLADARCQGIIIATDANDVLFAGLPVAGDARVRRVNGGARRCESVGNALQDLAAPDDDWVLVHDAARPCVSRQEVDALLEACAADPVGGLLALPVSDTLKRAGADHRVLKTPPREGLWRALTPQMFRLGRLRQALAAARAAGRDPTDESQAIEWLGLAPLLVSGSAGNLKITTRDDLRLAATWLALEERP